MRLNRVLLLAASIICMVFAMVFTISCSGDDGKQGPAGKGCTVTAKADGTGYDVYCGDATEPVGQLLNGKDGSAVAKGDPGPVGPKGDKGDKGDTPKDVCVLGEKNEDGKYGIICGTESIEGGAIEGTLEQCSHSEVPGSSATIILKCGKDEIYACGGQVFNPETHFCELSYAANDDVGGVRIAVPTVFESICGSTTYNSKAEFCDGNTIRALCGGMKYESTLSETCVNNNVTKACGSSRYNKYTQFCMPGNKITARCGTANKDGVYASGSALNEETSDRTYSGKSVGTLLKGEYDEANDELCIEGKVVMKCGDGADAPTFEEKTHFCAVGDIIAPHCTDRVKYNTSQRFCSFIANVDYAPTGSACKLDPEDISCKQYISTALEFCGNGTGTDYRYNATRWNWEYCVAKDNPSGGTTNPVAYSRIRCGTNEIPDRSSGAAELCIAIEHATKVPGGNNSRCDEGYIYQAYETAGSSSLNCVADDDPPYYTCSGSFLTNYATGTPNVLVSGAGATSKIVVLPISQNGGYCVSAPACSGTASNTAGACITRSACLNSVTNVSTTNSGFYWDPRANSCIADDGLCSAQYFATAERVCSDEPQPCNVANPSVCSNKTACATAKGFWDMYVDRNRCVKTALGTVDAIDGTKINGGCNSRLANSSTWLCLARGETCPASLPVTSNGVCCPTATAWNLATKVCE